jgi:anti-sigma factor RsiW
VPDDVRRWEPRNIGVALAAIAFVALVLFFGRRTGRDQTTPPSPLVTEAVNDHLRVLYAEHPLEIESGEIHQVKGWFERRVDFAPIVAFDGDADFPLQGGSLAYYIDRKAAAFVYKRDLHLITLFVFPARGLPFPADRVTAASHGFHVIVWRSGDLGYALVSDVAAAELEIDRKLRPSR